LNHTAKLIPYRICATTQALSASILAIFQSKHTVEEGIPTPG